MKFKLPCRGNTFYQPYPFFLSTAKISTGKLMQYVPKNGVYVYFRYDAKQTVMVVLNTNDKPSDISTATYKDRIGSFTKGLIVGRNATVFLSETLSVPAKTAVVMELK